jgi:hypothetical protein
MPCALVLTICIGTAARAAEPIKIGMSMTLTGPLAGTGKAALLGTQIGVEDINAKGAYWAGRYNSSTTTIKATRRSFQGSIRSSSRSTR